LPRGRVGKKPEKKVEPMFRGKRHSLKPRGYRFAVHVTRECERGMGARKKTEREGEEGKRSVQKIVACQVGCLAPEKRKIGEEDVLRHPKS